MFIYCAWVFLFLVSASDEFLDPEGVKKCRTPSPTEEELDRYFHPISASSCSPVELQVTNLDQSIDAKELRRLLLAVFKEHVMVIY